MQSELNNYMLLPYIISCPQNEKLDVIDNFQGKKLPKAAYEVENPNKQKLIGEIDIIVTNRPPEGYKTNFLSNFYKLFEKQIILIPHQVSQCTGRDGTWPNLSDEMKSDTKPG